MKNIVFGVCSSIACYKVLDLVKKLKTSYNIEIIATKGALTLVKKEEFEQALGKEIHENVFEKGWDAKKYKEKKWMKHIDLADKADLFVVAPATANVIAKLANGLADDLLSTSVIATKAPILVCPAMNVNMWEHPIVKNNMEKLKQHSYEIAEPEEGKLACGTEGKGRLANLDYIEDEISTLIKNQEALKGKNILVTAGATLEPIDPIRYITNRSSGKMGIAIAEEAQKQGANVTLIRGKTEISPNGNITDFQIETVEQMENKIKEIIMEQDVMIHAAAVSDFYVKEKVHQKLKSGQELALELSPTTKILEKIKQLHNGIFLVGFKAEYDLDEKELIKRAKEIKKSANADIIVANDVSKKIFGNDESEVIIINNKEMKVKGLKKEIANKLLTYIPE